MKNIVAVSVYKWNNYITEYIDWYINKLKFDEIHIYNDSPDSYPDFIEIPYIDRLIKAGYVFVYDKYDIKKTYHTITQLNFYNWIYHNIDFDWCVCFDSDEFLYLTEDDNISCFFQRNQFADADCILLFWQYYTDNNNFFKSEKPVNERFTEKWSNLSKHTKCIVHKNVSDFCLKSPHCLGFEMPYMPKVVLPSGRVLDKAYAPLPNGFVSAEEYRLGYLKHFYTMSMEEYFIKVTNGRNDLPKTHPEYYRKINSYYLCNVRTQERDEMLHKFYEKYLAMGYNLKLE